MKDGTPQTTPRGHPVHARIIGAIQNLCDQFEVCGLEVPVAILVAEGQRGRIEAACRSSALMLVEDARCNNTCIWGVEIEEAS